MKDIKDLNKSGDTWQSSQDSSMNINQCQTKFQQYFLVSLDKFILKCVWKDKCPKTAKKILDYQRHCQQNSMNFCKTKVVWHRISQTDQ